MQKKKRERGTVGRRQKIPGLGFRSRKEGGSFRIKTA